MIGKVMIGKSFRGCLLYCLNDKKEEVKMKHRAEVLLFQNCGGNGRELIRQFGEVRALHMRLSKPVLHITLSLSEGEKLERKKLIQISERCAREMGFEKNQFLAVLHHDTAHQHIHIVANRIGFDGKAVSDSNSYRRIALFCRKMEKELGLKEVPSPKAFLSPKERILPRLDGRKEALRNEVAECLLLAKDYKEFEGLMKRKKITVERGRGITFIDNKKMRVKGSELSYSLFTIERIFERKEELAIKSDRHIKQAQGMARNEPENVLSSSIRNTAASLLASLLKGSGTNNEPIISELTEEAKKKKRKLRIG